MTKDSEVSRRLSAILSADVVGYSRLMGEDDEATVRSLKSSREIFFNYIRQYKGRVVDAKGDAVLAEFNSVVNAMRGAVEIQRELAEKNAGVALQKMMEFRIGIDLGEVLVENEYIFGDGVNIAARLESLSEPGGICISNGVYDNLKGRLELEYAFLGEQTVKNFKDPVKVYRVLLKPSAAAHRVVRAKNETLPGPAKPSVAVLPFTSMAADAEQGYFCDGITEDIITDLSKISGLSVVARNTVFIYKGMAVNIPLVAKELNATHVLKGSIRKAGGRIRINAQLVDAESGNHIWADRFDCDLSDVFDLQDEITASIVTALDVQLLEGEQARVWRKTTRDGMAYDLFLKGHSCWHKALNRRACTEAHHFYTQAIERDPTFAHAYYALARMHYYEAVHGWWKESPESSMETSRSMAEKAIKLEPLLADAYAVLAQYQEFKKDYEQAMHLMNRALELNPNGANLHVFLGRFNLFAGNPKTTVENIRVAMDLVPRRPSWMLMYLGAAHLMNDNNALAVTTLWESLGLAPDSIYTNVYLTAALAANGPEKEAREQGQEVLRIEPGFSLEVWAPLAMPFRHSAHLEKMKALLRKGGLE